MPTEAAQTVQTVQSEIIETISEAAGIGSIGLLSPAADHSIAFSGGKQIKKYMDGSGLYKMDLRIFGKGTDQLSLANKMCGICNFLSHTDIASFRKKDTWEIRGISVDHYPAIDEQSGNGTWYYSCGISVIYFLKA